MKHTLKQAALPERRARNETLLKIDAVKFLFEYRVVGIGARYWLDGAGIEPL